MPVLRELVLFLCVCHRPDGRCGRAHLSVWSAQCVVANAQCSFLTVPGSANVNLSLSYCAFVDLSLPYCAFMVISMLGN